MCDGSAGFGESPNERSDVIVAIGDRKGSLIGCRDEWSIPGAIRAEVMPPDTQLSHHLPATRKIEANRR